jgi:hypothetical protein
MGSDDGQKSRKSVKSLRMMLAASVLLNILGFAYFAFSHTAGSATPGLGAAPDVVNNGAAQLRGKMVALSALRSHTTDVPASNAADANSVRILYYLRVFDEPGCRTALKMLHVVCMPYHEVIQLSLLLAHTS